MIDEYILEKAEYISVNAVRGIRKNNIVKFAIELTDKDGESVSLLMFDSFKKCNEMHKEITDKNIEIDTGAFSAEEMIEHRIYNGDL